MWRGDTPQTCNFAGVNLFGTSSQFWWDNWFDNTLGANGGANCTQFNWSTVLRIQNVLTEDSLTLISPARYQIVVAGMVLPTTNTAYNLHLIQVPPFTVDSGDQP